MNSIDVFIFALQEQMKKMDNKKSDVYLTLKACKDLAEDIKKESEKINVPKK
jgi:hypothetical protein